MTPPIRIRHGLTLIELLVVVSIAAMLSAIAAPSAVQAMRKGAMNATVSSVMEVCHEARSLAVRSNPPPEDGRYACFGVILVDPADGNAFAAVTYGTADEPTESDVLVAKTQPWSTWEEYLAAPDKLDPSGNPIAVARVEIQSGFGFYHAAPDDLVGTAQPVARITWLFQHQSGALIDRASPTADWVHLGHDPAILIREHGGTRGATLEIFPMGLIHSVDLGD